MKRSPKATRAKTASAKPAKATLTISSKNYSSWSLRGWLLCRMAGLSFQEKILPSDDPSIRAELLLLSPSFQVPRLTHDGVSVWDTLALAEYPNELYPKAGLLPAEPKARAHCRSISGEMHSGFANLRSALWRLGPNRALLAVGDRGRALLEVHAAAGAVGGRVLGDPDVVERRVPEHVETGAHRAFVCRTIDADRHAADDGDSRAREERALLLFELEADDVGRQNEQPQREQQEHVLWRIGHHPR